MLVHTEIEIEAPAARVWDIITDFAAYPEWNPMIPRINGAPRVGSQVAFRIKVGKVALPIDAEVVIADEPYELRWIGPARPWMRRVAHGSHYYRIIDLGDDLCRLEHGEEFSGPLLPARWRRGEDLLAPGYAAFNRAVKRRAEL